jgi:hypothetical protein
MPLLELVGAKYGAPVIAASIIAVGAYLQVELERKERKKAAQSPSVTIKEFMNVTADVQQQVLCDTLQALQTESHSDDQGVIIIDTCESCADVLDESSLLFPRCLHFSICQACEAGE